MIQLLVYDHLNFPALSAKWLGPLTGNKLNNNLSVSRASFCRLERGGAKEALPESHQTFETAAAQTFGLVNRVSVSNWFPSVSISVLTMIN